MRDNRTLTDLLRAAREHFDEADERFERMSARAELGQISYQEYDSARFDSWERSDELLGALLGWLTPEALADLGGVLDDAYHYRVGEYDPNYEEDMEDADREGVQRAKRVAELMGRRLAAS